VPNRGAVLVARRRWDGKTLCPRYAGMDKRYVKHEHTHPSINCYDNHGCACPDCLEVARQAEKRRLPGGTPPATVE
jgi:hypothetical protein